MLRTTRRMGLAFAMLLLLGTVGLAAEPVEITLMWWLSDVNKAEHEANLKIIERFEELHPHIKVNLLFTEYSTFTDQTFLLSVTGQAPDVVWVVQDDFYDVATSGILLDLTPFIESDPDLDLSVLLPGVFELGHVRGVPYALYRDVYPQNLFYNRDQFILAGFSDPRPGWTYDDMARTAQRLTNAEELRWGMGNIQDDWQSIVLSFGGRFMNEDQTEFRLHETEAVQAFNYIYELIWVYQAQPTSSSGLAGWAEPQFMAGQVAMLYRGPYRWTDFNRQLDFEWDVAPTPTGPAGAYAALEGLRVSIMAGTKHPQEAWELVKFLCTSEEAQAMQVELGIASPVVTYGSVLQKFFESPDAPRSIGNYIQSLTTSSRMGLPHLPGPVITLVNNMVQQIRRNELDVNTAILEMERQAHAHLRELDWRPGS